MHQYKHYSFDMWGTLIKPNDDFTLYRAGHIWSNYNGKDENKKTHLQVVAIIREVGKYADEWNLFTGRSMSPLEMYTMVLYRVRGTLNGLTRLTLELLYKEIEQIFLQYHPTVYSDDTIPALEELRRRGKYMSILSNTAYIRGATLNKVLRMLNIATYFNFAVYSDTHDLSKPNYELFRVVGDKSPFHTEDIIHVGDSEIMDGAGAHEAGFGHFIINSNSYTIKDLL